MFCDLPGDFTFISPLSETIILDWEDVVTQKNNFSENIFSFIWDMKEKNLYFSFVYKYPGYIGKNVAKHKNLTITLF